MLHVAYINRKREIKFMTYTALDAKSEWFYIRPNEDYFVIGFVQCGINRANIQQHLFVTSSLNEMEAFLMERDMFKLEYIRDENFRPAFDTFWTFGSSIFDTSDAEGVIWNAATPFTGFAKASKAFKAFPIGSEEIDIRRAKSLESDDPR